MPSCCMYFLTTLRLGAQLAIQYAAAYHLSAEETAEVLSDSLLKGLLAAHHDTEGAIRDAWTAADFREACSVRSLSCFQGQRILALVAAVLMLELTCHALCPDKVQKIGSVQESCRLLDASDCGKQVVASYANSQMQESDAEVGVCGAGSGLPGRPGQRAGGRAAGAPRRAPRRGGSWAASGRSWLLRGSCGC